MTDIKVAFPEPCSEPWEGMASAGCHRHCAACDKVIHDLAAMTLEEAEGLLAQPDGACVRARIAPDGTVALADSKRTAGRRLVAAVGASLTLAASACQTPLVGPVSPRFEVTGEMPGDYRYSRFRLVSESGKTYRPDRIAGDRFRFGNLLPGRYTPLKDGLCSETEVAPAIVVVDGDIEVGQLAFEGGQQDCIIIGVMTPADNWRG